MIGASKKVIKNKKEKMSKSTIDYFNAAEEQDILKLHKSIFEQVFLEYYQDCLDNFVLDLKSERILVAHLDNSLVGFAGFRPLKEDDMMKKSLQNALYWASNQSEESRLLEFMEEAREQFGKGEALVKNYSNMFSEGDTKINNTDIYFSAIAVHPEYRRRGLAEALTKRRIFAAKERNATALYVSCWEGGHVSKLYEKIGFLPILKAGPRYPDGNPEKVMGFFAEQPILNLMWNQNAISLKSTRKIIMVLNQ